MPQTLTGVAADPTTSPQATAPLDTDTGNAASVDGAFTSILGFIAWLRSFCALKNMAGGKITNLGAGSTAGDSVNFPVGNSQMAAGAAAANLGFTPPTQAYVDGKAPLCVARIHLDNGQTTTITNQAGPCTLSGTASGQIGVFLVSVSPASLTSTFRASISCVGSSLGSVPMTSLNFNNAASLGIGKEYAGGGAYNGTADVIVTLWAF